MVSSGLAEVEQTKNGPRYLQTAKDDLRCLKIMACFIEGPGVDLRVLDLLVGGLADHHVAGQAAPGGHRVVEVASAHHCRLLPYKAKDGCISSDRQMSCVCVEKFSHICIVVCCNTATLKTD